MHEHPLKNKGGDTGAPLHVGHPLIKTFWTAVSFLQCHNIEYNSLFIAALKIVDLCMSKKSTHQPLEREENMQN